MPSQDSPSASPLKRPGLAPRTSSTHSLSSSAKHQHKVHRTHLVGHRTQQHGRNPSYGKNLNKLTRLTSTANLHVEGGRHHQRKKSGPVAPEPPSPRGNIKRNSSHVSLPRVSSQASLKKNQSTISLSHNASTAQLKKPGLAPMTRIAPEQKENTVGGFQLGDNSSEEEEAEWEDSSHSPDTTRQNSTTENARYDRDVAGPSEHIRHNSPPPLLQDHHKSAPTLSRNRRSIVSLHGTDETPSLLHHNPRSTRAPPAISSVAAFARPPSSVNLKNAQGLVEPGQASSSTENGVSHFVDGSLGANGTPKTIDLPSDDDEDEDEDDDDDAPSSFLPHYHPQPAADSSHTHSRSSSGLLNRRSNGATLPSRTQQRLELQRRETMRAATNPSDGDPVDVPLALRARSGSRGRGKAAHDIQKIARRNYETAGAQLEVIKRYRNPVVEALGRLRDMNVLPEKGGKSINGIKDRPVSRAGSRKSVNMRNAEELALAQETGSKSDSTAGLERTPSRGRVRFQRQGSHDDIGLSRSHREEDVDEVGDGEDGDDSINAEQALLRRMWDSREVYEAN